MKIIFLLFLILVGFLSCETNELSDQIKKSSFIREDSLIVFIGADDWHLYKVNLDGTGETLLSDSFAICYTPVVSNRGDKILFCSYVIDIDGENMMLIDQANIYFPVWSPDDSKIIYSRNYKPGGEERDLILFEFSTGDKKILLSTGDNIARGFIDNKRILYTHGPDIYIMNIDGSSNNRIISNGAVPVLSPDHKKIAYIWITQEGPQIYVAEINGSNIKQLTDEYLKNWDAGWPTFGNRDPHWTPDSDQIVYVSEIRDGFTDIYIMNSDGSNKKRLTYSEGRNEMPQVSSDGNRIMFVSNRDPDHIYKIYQMDLSGDNQYSLTSGLFPVFVSVMTNMNPIE